MSIISCLNGEGCLGGIYNAATKKPVVVISVIVETAFLAIGVLALTHILPGIGVLTGSVLTGIGGCFLIVTIALACSRRCLDNRNIHESLDTIDPPEIKQDNKVETKKVI